MTFMQLGSVEGPEIDISIVLATAKDLRITGFYQNDMNYMEKVQEKEMLFKGSNDILGILQTELQNIFNKRGNTNSFSST